MSKRQRGAIPASCPARSRCASKSLFRPTTLGKTNSPVRPLRRLRRRRCRRGGFEIRPFPFLQQPIPLPATPSPLLNESCGLAHPTVFPQVFHRRKTHRFCRPCQPLRARFATIHRFGAIMFWGYHKEVRSFSHIPADYVVANSVGHLLYMVFLGIKRLTYPHAGSRIIGPWRLD